MDRTGTLFLRIKLKLNYKDGSVDLSMPGYIKEALEMFQHPVPPRHKYLPYPAPNTKWGPDSQLTAPKDESKQLHAVAVNRLKQFFGTLLYYAQAVDPTMVKAIDSLASQQSEATNTTSKRMTHLLNYSVSHPNATIPYTQSVMILHSSSDASHLSEPKDRSCVGGHFFLDKKYVGKEIPKPKLNVPVHTVSNILRNVMASAGEAEFTALFHNCKDGIMIRNTLIEMGHPLPAITIQTDNQFSEGFSKRRFKQL